MAARAANLSAPAWLFVDILNAYAAHHAGGNPNITPSVLQVAHLSVCEGPACGRGNLYQCSHMEWGFNWRDCLCFCAPYLLCICRLVPTPCGYRC